MCDKIAYYNLLGAPAKGTVSSFDSEYVFTIAERSCVNTISHPSIRLDNIRLLAARRALLEKRYNSLRTDVAGNTVACQHREDCDSN